MYAFPTPGSMKITPDEFNPREVDYSILPPQLSSPETIWLRELQDDYEQNKNLLCKLALKVIDDGGEAVKNALFEEIALKKTP